MNNKWQKIHIYQQLNLENKLSKQEDQRLNHGCREHADGCQAEGRCGRMGEDVRGSRSTNGQLQSRHGVVKYSGGNRVVKELIHVTHGHENVVGIA